MNESDTHDSVERLAAEFIDRCRQGETPTIGDYLAEYPELADTIADLFPMIAALEGMKQDEQKSAARFATTRPLQLTELGDFKIIREIGRGGMGIVYEAEQGSLDRRVALKVLPKQALLDPAQLKRFEREARIAARLHHTHLVSLFGVGEHEGFHFLVMEYIDGASLDKVIPQVRQLLDGTSELAESIEPAGNGDDRKTSARLARMLFEPAANTNSQLNNENGLDTAGSKQTTSDDKTRYWQHVARIGRDAANALQHASDRGVLHRDIKPGNLILDSTGNIWISDFGLAQPLYALDATVTKSLGGTLSYLPPEALTGKVDARSDVYGLGLTLYELLTRQPAFRDDSQAQAMNRLASQSFDAEKPNVIDSSIPCDLETVILKAMAHQPNRRYPSALDFANDLQRFIDDRPVLARRTSSLERFRRWCLRNKAVSSLTALAATLLILVSVVSVRGYFNARQASNEVSAALDREMEQRERSEATLLIAADVLDGIYKEFAPGSPHNLDGFGAVDPVPDKLGGTTSQPNSSPALSNETAAVLENLLSFYDRLAEQGGSSNTLKDASAQAMGRIGDIYQQLGQRTKALQHYGQALEIYQEMQQENPASFLLVNEQARLHNDIGRVQFVSGNLKAAHTSYRRALQVLKSYDQSSDRPIDAYEKARALYLLGKKPPTSISKVALDQLTNLGNRESHGRRPPPRRTGNGEPARRRHKELNHAIDTLKNASAGTRDSPAYQFLLACCYRELPPKPGGWLKFEQSHSQNALELLTDLVKRFPEDQNYRFELVETLRRSTEGDRRGRQADERMLGQLAQALPHVDYLIERHPNVPTYAMARMHVLHKRGHFLVRRAEREPKLESMRLQKQAVEAQQLAAEQMERLTSRWPDVAVYQLWSIVVDGSLSQVYLKIGAREEAKLALDSAIQALETLSDSENGRTTVGDSLPDIRKAMSVLRDNSGN